MTEPNSESESARVVNVLEGWKASLTGFGIFHLFDLGVELNKRSRLEKIYTAADFLRVLKYRSGIPISKCSFDWLPPRLRGSKRKAAASGRMRSGIRRDKSTVTWSLPTSAKASFSAAPSSLKILDIDHVNWNSSVAENVANLGLTKFDPDAVLPESIPNQFVRLSSEHRKLGLDFDIPDAQIIGELAECELADVLIVPVSYVRDALVAIGYPENMIVTIPYGFSSDDFFPADRAVDASGGTQPPLKVVFAGSITVRKGWRHLKEIINRCAVQGNVEFVLAGGIDPTLQDDVTELIRQHGSTVAHLGWLSKSKLGGLMRSSDLAIYPSVFEGFGMTVIQALACGVPVITTPATAGIDLVVPGKNGYIFEYDEYDRWTDAIMTLAGDRTGLPAMKSAAAKAVSEMSWSHYVDRLESVIREVI